MDSEKELWKVIKGYNNIYEISNFGRVKSKDHFVKLKNGVTRIQKGRILKTHICKKGYLMVTISNNGKRFHTFVHRLIAIAFIPNTENKPQVNHINGVKTDNRIENLEWCTNSENQIHAVKNNLIIHNLGEKHHMSKLTNSQIKEARELSKKGCSGRYLSKKYNISAPAMSKILRNETYINI